MVDVNMHTRAGTWDWHTANHVFGENAYGLPEDMKGDIFVDIGGHIGSAAIRAATSGATVITYEPGSDNYRMLCENIKDNDIHNITAVNKAVGPKGKALLIIDPVNTGQNTIFEERNDFGGTVKEEVEMVPLEEVLQGIDRCYLKMDCEGGEVEIIKEIVAGLHKKIHTIVVEFHFPELTPKLIEDLEQFYTTEQLSRYEYKFKRRFRCLYMGAGKERVPGCLHADSYPYPGIDVVCDATKPWPWPDNTFEKVVTRDFLEHIPPESKVFVINEMWRVLKQNGTMEHYVPNAGSQNDFGSPSHLSHWNLQQFEHFDVDSYRHEKDKDYEGITSAFKKVGAELMHMIMEADGVMRYQSIHVVYQAVK